jgi:hypothetical protein
MAVICCRRRRLALGGLGERDRQLRAVLWTGGIVTLTEMKEKSSVPSYFTEDVIDARTLWDLASQNPTLSPLG